MDYKGKLAKHLILKQDPITLKHLPITNWYSEKNFEDMLKRFSTIYIKPDVGSQGKNIVRVKIRKDNVVNISYDENNIIVAEKEIVAVLKKIIRDDTKYIVQQGIELATYNKHPFDIRVVLQKPYGTWQVTLTSAKVAKGPDSVVTNVAQGAKDYLLHEILKNYDQSIDPICSMREIIDLSHRTAEILHKNIPLEILGLDLALDKKGDLWIIEANTHPACSKCKLVNDETSVDKYESAKMAVQSGKKYYKVDKAKIKRLNKKTYLV